MSSIINGHDYEKNKLIIIDGYGLLFRAYYAIPQMLSSENVPVAAIYGFIKSFRSILGTLGVKNYTNGKLAVAVALDGCRREDNFRYKLYNEYKSNRGLAPGDLLVQLRLARPMLEAFGIPYLVDTTGEADDVIATYARHAVENEYNVTVVSNDKDLAQLMSDKVSFYDINKRTLCTIQDIQDRFGVMPNQILDYLSIVGDAADNIPGIKGIGPKNAAALIQEFNDLDNIYNNLDKITPTKIKNLLVKGYDQAILARSLVMLNDKLDIKTPLDTMQWLGFKNNSNTISKFLKDYSLESLMGILK